MSKILDDIRDVFSIFHDGGISNFELTEIGIRLTIECEYLAELIDPDFKTFYVEFWNLQKLELDPWMNPIELEKVIKTEPEEIFKTELEILSAEIENEYVKVTCIQHDNNFDYCGGHLLISAETFKVENERKQEMTIDELDSVCNTYWSKFNEKKENHLQQEL